MDSGDFQDYYRDLGLEIGASYNAIKSAFHTLAKQHHPDKSGTQDSTVFRAAREAYEKLTDLSFRTAYDRTYWRAKFRSNNIYIPGAKGYNFGYTRTEQYEAEELARGPSPPPVKPYRMANQPDSAYYNSRAYQQWQTQDDAHRARHPERDEKKARQRKSNPIFTLAHGLRVQMAAHPAATEQCGYRTQQWRMQIGGQDHCVFCLRKHTDGFRCPGCEALACPNCLQEIITLETNVLSGFGWHTQYRPSGG